MSKQKHNELTNSTLSIYGNETDEPNHTYLNICNIEAKDTKPTNHYAAIGSVSLMADGESTKVIHKRIMATWNFCSGVSYKKLNKLLKSGITLKDLLKDY